MGNQGHCSQLRDEENDGRNFAEKPNGDCGKLPTELE